MNNIIDSIRSYYPVSDDAIERLKQDLIPMEFSKKEFIVKGGVPSRYVYFIEKGITRSFCLIDGKEISTWFSKEGDITFGLLDLYHNLPGFEYVETLEPCLTYAMPIDKLNEIYKENLDIANWSRVVHQECLLQLQYYRIDRLYLPAKIRYLKLMESFPDLWERVNLGYIASFLGITQPFLSKLRSECQKETQIHSKDLYHELLF